MGANDTNTVSDHEAINLEAEAIAQEFNRLMTNNTYKGKNVFVDTANSEFVSMGGREAEMTFGIGEFDYSELYGDARIVNTGLPNAGTQVNLTFLPSDAVLGPVMGFDPDAGGDDVLGATDILEQGKSYKIITAPSANQRAAHPARDAL